MFVFETTAKSPRELQRVTAAFYRFLEEHGDACCEQAAMHIERGPGAQRISIHLWSAEAIAAYVRRLSMSSATRRPRQAARPKTSPVERSGHA